MYLLLGKVLGLVVDTDGIEHWFKDSSLLYMGVMAKRSRVFLYCFRFPGSSGQPVTRGKLDDRRQVTWALTTG